MHINKEQNKGGIVRSSDVDLPHLGQGSRGEWGRKELEKELDAS